jgi:hypothetical protein
LITKNSPAQATGAHITIIGHITKDELLRELARTELANGFTNRFLWICAKRSKCLPEGGALNGDDLEQYGRTFARLLAHARRVGEMTRTSAARDLWADVYPRLSAGRAGLLGAVDLTRRSHHGTPGLSVCARGRGGPGGRPSS